jgi:divalent metal cation (Fe/Co/Zn/Cd) transporter
VARTFGASDIVNFLARLIGFSFYFLPILSYIFSALINITMTKEKKEIMRSMYSQLVFNTEQEKGRHLDNDANK